MDAVKGANRSLQELLYHSRARQGGEGEKKEKPTQKQPALQAPPAQRPARWCGAGRLGWSEECGGSFEACAPRPARPELPSRTPRRGTAFRWGLGTHARRAPGCRAPRTAALPGRPRAARDSGTVSAPSPVCRRGRPSGSSRARAHLCAFSRAARGGERRRPRWASPARPLRRRRLPQPSGTPGGGRFALLLIHEATTRAGDWAAGRCARPASAGTDTRCRRLTPLGAHFPASAPEPGASRGGAGGGSSGSDPGSWNLAGDPLPSCPSSKPGLLRQHSLGAYGRGTVFAGRARISLVFD